MLSIGLSVLAMYLVYQYIDGENKKLEADYGKFWPIVVATRDILQYETIRPTDLEVIRIPNALLPLGDIADPNDVIDAIAAVPITKGEHLIDNKIISKNVYSGLDTQITQGRRAMSIPVNLKSAVGFLIRPGNRVDLAAHFDYRSPSSNISEVKVFMQDLLVLATGRTIQPEPPKAVDQGIVREVLSAKDLERTPTQQELRESLNHAKTDPNYLTLTLEVTPVQAQQILYVLTVYGESLTCFLRNSDDRQLARISTVNLRDVLGADSFYAKGPKLPPLQPGPRIQGIDRKGGVRSPYY